MKFMIEWMLENEKIVNIFSGVGTFISALIAVFTLAEVKKQRLSMYKPEMLIKSFLVSISRSPLIIEDEGLKYKTSTLNDFSKNYNEILFNHSKNYKVENVGFGIGKEITCKWVFDSKEALKVLEEVLPENYKVVHYDNLDLHILQNITDESFHYSMYGKTSTQKIDYLTPINVQEHFHYHTIPESIIFTHYLYLIFKYNLVQKISENFNIHEFVELPKPKLQLSYFDINGKKYFKEIEFRMSAVSSQIPEKINMTEEFAMLQFRVS